MKITGVRTRLYEFRAGPEARRRQLPARQRPQRRPRHLPRHRRGRHRRDERQPRLARHGPRPRRRATGRPGPARRARPLEADGRRGLQGRQPGRRHQRHLRARHRPLGPQGEDRRRPALAHARRLRAEGQGVRQRHRPQPDRRGDQRVLRRPGGPGRPRRQAEGRPGPGGRPPPAPPGEGGPVALRQDAALDDRLERVLVAEAGDPHHQPHRGGVRPDLGRGAGPALGLSRAAPGLAGASRRPSRPARTCTRSATSWR